MSDRTQAWTMAVVVFAVVAVWAMMQLGCAWDGTNWPDMPWTNVVPDEPDVPADPEPTNAPAESEPPESLPNAKPIHAPEYTHDGAEYVPWGGGALWNPKNKHGQGKLIVPGKWTGTVSLVYGWDLAGTRYAFYRAKPDEHGNRQRYYSKVPIHELPTQMAVRVDRVVNGKAADRFFVIADTQVRWE